MGEPILVIDGDMRSPDLHNFFEVALTPGLAQVLGSECLLSEAIVAGWHDRVDVLPAGKLGTTPHKLLGNGEWKDILAAVPARYRYVIIDTPPVLAASEALVLAKGADAALVCVMRDVSRVDHVKRACERLLAVGGRPIGIVLSGIPASRYVSFYGQYPMQAKGDLQACVKT